MTREATAQGVVGHMRSSAHQTDDARVLRPPRGVPGAADARPRPRAAGGGATSDDEIEGGDGSPIANVATDRAQRARRAGDGDGDEGQRDGDDGEKEGIVIMRPEGEEMVRPIKA